MSGYLSSAQAERLALLAEECGEVVKAIGKILRHGYESYNPDETDVVSNREALTREAGDVIAAIGIMLAAGDLRRESVRSYERSKLARVSKYLHHDANQVAASQALSKEPR